MFDPKKPVQTRDGREAKILYVSNTHFASGDTIVAEVGGRVRTFRSDGRLSTEGDVGVDLVNIPPQPRHHHEIAARFMADNSLRIKVDGWLETSVDYIPEWVPRHTYHLIDADGNILMTSEAEK